MAGKLQSLRAEERSTAITQAMTDWRKLAAVDSEQMPWRRGTVLWNQEHGYWSFFGKASADTALGWRWWNTFGRIPEAFGQHMLVEINPPQKGPAKGTQGLVAMDDSGRRILLHGGRLRPPGRQISSGEFRALSKLATMPVAFSDGRVLPYFPVASLDDGAEVLNRGVAAFVAVCEDVRNQVLYGAADADFERRVRHGEGSSTPEKRGAYVIPPRPAAWLSEFTPMSGRLSPRSSTAARRRTATGGSAAMARTCARGTSRWCCSRSRQTPRLARFTRRWGSC